MAYAAAMPSKPTVAANGWVTYSATISAPIWRAKHTPLLAACADRGDPSVGISMHLNIIGPLNKTLKPPSRDRTSVVKGKSGSVRVDLGGRRILKKTNTIIKDNK